MLVRSWRTSLSVGALALAMLVGTAAPSSAFLDKTRFVAHLGVAYFAFHHWVWLPYRLGAFQSGAPHRLSTIVKGGVALLFAYHEVRVAEKIAHDSKDPLLQKFDGALSGLEANFQAVGQKFKAGQFSPQDVASLGASTTSIKSLAQSAGLDIQDKPVPVPVPGL
ncbi:MAG TPA: hypothetical protein VMD91_08460 [Candidatus Sulfotelmatobacter sp.]|nr:hypothetical protein [Candidatus Sulfotelmatobacter sp.]